MSLTVSVIVLLSIAALLGALTMPRRNALVDDPTCDDVQVLRWDQWVSGVLVVLFAAAAICALVDDASRPEDRSATPAVLAGVAAVIASAVTGGYVVRVVLAAGGIPTRSDNFDDDPDHAPPLRGGRVIGVLERIAVTTCLLLGWPAGIAVILGVKGLARFSELRAPHASEQFILGTAASVLWACAAAGIGVLAA